MIDYNIAVSVEGFTKDQKQEVLDLFEKLGYNYRGDNSHLYLDESAIVYTNFSFFSTYNDGAVFWNSSISDSIEPYLISLEKLRKMTKPFDINDLQDRDEVYFRDGGRCEIYKDALLNKQYNKVDYLGSYNCNLVYADSPLSHPRDIVKVVRNGKTVFVSSEVKEELLRKRHLLNEELKRIEDMLV